MKLPFSNPFKFWKIPTNKEEAIQHIMQRTKDMSPEEFKEYELRMYKISHDKVHGAEEFHKTWFDMHPDEPCPVCGASLN